MRTRRILFPRWHLFGLLALVLFCGCVSAKRPLFVVSGPGWTISQGQALWRPGGNYPELGGEVMMARHSDGRCLVEFTKSSLPFVLAQTTESEWLIQFPSRGWSFTGRWPPANRFGWLQVSGLLAGKSLSAPFEGRVEADGSWRLANTRSGESITGYLAP